MSWNVEVVKRSKVSPRGALNLPAARRLQTERCDPLPAFCDAGARAAGRHGRTWQQAFTSGKDCWPLLRSSRGVAAVV